MNTRRILIASGIICVVALAVGLGVGLGTKDNTVDDDTGADYPENEDEPWLNFRLPDSILPTHYDITLRPNVLTNINYGHEFIHIDVLKQTDKVIIHALEGDFTDVTSFTVTQDGSVLTKVDAFYYNDESKQQYYVVILDEQLDKGKAELEIEWKGILNGTLVGINKVIYEDQGEEKYIIATKFEPTYAREAFPCFDEPAMKATYSLAMYHECTHQGLWNMPVTKITENCEDCEGQCRTEFEMSPAMGTYQPTFIIHDMDFIEDNYTRDDGTVIPLRVYAPYDKIPQAHHALTVQKYVSEHYEEEFGYPYPLPKLDLIAIPDFVTGAMEQWGLITFRETSLLWDPVEGSTSSKQSTSSTIAHEMVHQWFGNLVTMEWWDNIWLNEGFATFYKYGAIEEAFPEEDWDTENQQIYSDIMYSLNKDVVSSSRPIIADVRNPDEITAAFDWVIYQKGSSVIHMIKEALGAEAYHDAIQSYLDRCKYSTATDEILFDEFQKQIDAKSISVDGEDGVINATELWMPFLRQPLYPLYEVAENTDTWIITQKSGPFLHNPDSASDLPESEYDYKYPMIIRYICGDKTGEILFKEGEAKIKKSECKSEDVIKFNPKQTSFHRVKYNTQMREDLEDLLKTNPLGLDQMDRAGLMDDAFHLAIAGEYTYPEALDTVNYISNIEKAETSYYAWNLFNSRTSYMRAQMSGTTTGEDFLEHFRPAIEKQFKDFGFSVEDNESHMEKKTRSTIVSLAVSFGVEDAYNEATKMFQDWISGGNKPHPDVRGTVYNLGVEQGDQSDWKFVYEQYINEKVASEKKALMRALAASQDVETIDYMLNVMAMDKMIILEQDFFNFIAYISYSDIGNQMTFDWTRVHWAELVERFGAGDRNFGRMVPGIVDGYNTEYGLWAANDFFKVTEEDAGAGAGPRENALDQIKSNIQWRENYIGEIQEWLNSFDEQ